MKAQTGPNLILKSRIILLFGYEKNFAEAIGLDAPRLSKIIQNRLELNEQEKKKWAAALECEVKDLWAR